ncbi:MAG: MarR family transcriptional regulator [Phyllobacteriaceae bacterium]|nr:MarR family transcriptional regulator [Phyllobacteriaceae bacterium]
MSLDRRRSAGYMTNWAARLFASAIERRLKSRRLSSAHLPIFFALGGGEALTQKDLAAVAAVEQPTMAATLARMERDGLIRRDADPDDGRSSLISLTDTALSALDDVRRATDAVNALALAALDDAERDAFLAMLDRVVAALAEDAPAKPPRSTRRPHPEKRSR